MKKPVFEANHLSFSYEGNRVLDDLSFSIQAGENVAILGANGSGKSTLLKLLNALQFATAGSLHFSGSTLTSKYFEDENREFAFRRQVGFVFQDPDVQLFNQTVWNEIAFGPLQMGLPENEVLKRVNQAMAVLGIEKLKDRSPFTLSGGEKKRVAIASILSIQPSVWLMDEPLASLDPRSQSRLIDFVTNRRALGETFVTATHDLGLLPEMADRVIVISEDHQLAADESVMSLLKRKQFLVTHNLIHDHRHTHGSKQHEHQHLHVSVHGQR